MPIELSIDHTGPMSRNVEDNALLLEVLAGEDGLDPRQYNPKTAPYTKALGNDIRGTRIAVVKKDLIMKILKKMWMIKLMLPFWRVWGL